MFKSGFVSIFGLPNAGKSTLLNALVGEKLAIVSPKVQTTRHRIKAILNDEQYQIVLSDTPGIIEAKYRLHEKMMHSVKTALEDNDVAVLLVDINDDPAKADEVFKALSLKVPAIVVLNKTDLATEEKVNELEAFFEQKDYCKKVTAVSALLKANLEGLIKTLVEFLPEGEPFFSADEMTDLPTRFFVAELIREKIYDLYEEEIPYHTAVLVQEFKEKETLVKIRADIIVQRETQKGIILGGRGKKIKELGTLARKEIEKFIGRKVFLELFVKVRPKWRETDLYLREYGY